MNAFYRDISVRTVKTLVWDFPVMASRSVNNPLVCIYARAIDYCYEGGRAGQFSKQLRVYLFLEDHFNNKRPFKVF